MPSRPRISVLFICIGNSCRSPMAEGIARVEGADFLKVSSAGLAPLGSVAELSLKTLEKNGYHSRGLSSKAIQREAWDAADVIINMSGYPRERAFPDYRKVEDWKVQDPYGADPEVYQRIFEDIQRRVSELIRRLRVVHKSSQRGSTSQGRERT